MEQVFISYSRRDIDFVKRLAEDLKSAGYAVWYDLSGLEAGTRWGSEIENALRQSRYFLVVLSPNSRDSEWVEREFLYASNQRLKVVPILYKPCILPLWCLNLHYLELREENYESGLSELLRILGAAVKPAEEKKEEESQKVQETRMEMEAVEKPPVPQPAVEKKEEKSPGAQEIRKEMEPVEKPSTTPPAREKRKTSFWLWAVIAGVGFIAAALILFKVIPLRGTITATFTPPSSTDMPTSPATATHVPTDTATLPPTVNPILTHANKLGETVTRQADGMVMVAVPEGDFIMGSPAGTGSLNEYPQHTVYLDDFWIDRTEVTNAMYALCVQAGRCTPPADSSSATRSSYYGNPQYNDYPVINVDWYQASAYCFWAGAHLPTEAEWEKVARGTEGATYPWGNNAPGERLLNYAGYIGDTTTVGSYPSGASPYGALDTAGNVMEWVNDWFSDTYYSLGINNDPQGPAYGTDKVVRGSSWDIYSLAITTRSTARHYYSITTTQAIIGFRCAISAVR
jgi:eukaryotic-like serine/threonine-protein kinase